MLSHDNVFINRNYNSSFKQKCGSKSITTSSELTPSITAANSIVVKVILPTSKCGIDRDHY